MAISVVTPHNIDKGAVVMGMTFGTALSLLQSGRLDSITPYSQSCSKSPAIKCQIPDEHSKMTDPYLYKVCGKTSVPWTPTQEDLFDKWMGVQSCL